MITTDTFGLCRQSPIYNTHHVNDWCGQYADNLPMIEPCVIKRGRPFKNKELVKIIGETK